MRATISSGEPRIRRRDTATASAGSAAISLRRLHGLRLDLARRHDRIDQAAGLRLLGVERLAHHQQLEGAPMPHQARRQQARSGLRHQPEADERRREARIGRRDHIVAMQQHGGADADRDALDGGDQRPLGSAPAHGESAPPAVPSPSPAVAACAKSPRSLPAENAPGTPAMTHAADRRRRRSRFRAPPPSRRTSRRSARSSCPAGSSGSVRTGPSSVTMT